MMEEDLVSETISEQDVIVSQNNVSDTVETDPWQRSSNPFSTNEHHIEEENQLFTDVPLMSLHHHTGTFARPSDLTGHHMFSDTNHQQHQHVIDQSNVKYIAEELFPSKTASRDAGDSSFSSFHDRSFFGKIPTEQGVHNPFE
jgi:hypothetical protein